MFLPPNISLSSKISKALSAGIIVTPFIENGVLSFDFASEVRFLKST
jgi:hypothetical protein